MAHTLGDKSKAVYNTLHPELQLVVDLALDYSVMDFSLTEGHRPVQRQLALFQKGRDNVNGVWVLTRPKERVTNVDGVKIKGNHNYQPSLAFDFTAYIPGKPELTWDKSNLSYLGATFMMCAEFLYAEGEISHKLKWGGDWDRDGDMTDQRLVDMPHLELYKP